MADISHMTEDSLKLLVRLLMSIKATEQDITVISLLLDTEEHAETFFAWAKEQTKDPTPQECFEKAVEIRGIDMDD